MNITWQHKFKNHYLCRSSKICNLLTSRPCLFWTTIKINAHFFWSDETYDHYSDQEGNAQMCHKNYDDRYDEVCGWNSIQDIARCSVFYSLSLENLTLTCDFELQSRSSTDHWMHLIGLYLGTKYEVYRWNILRDMASCLVFYPFWGQFYLDLWPWTSVKVIGT